MIMLFILSHKDDEYRHNMSARVADRRLCFYDDMKWFCVTFFASVLVNSNIMVPNVIISVLVLKK
jgi:hypothetical protein